MGHGKVIGLLGGMSWLSTADYYAKLNQKANAHFGERWGGRYAPEIAISSLNLQEFTDNLDADRRDANIDLLTRHAQALERAGAECLAFCSNTPHVFAPEVASRITIPLIHIADATADAIREAGCQRVALMGTRFTMGATFYPEKLAERGIERFPLPIEDEAWIHATISDELTRDIFTEPTRQGYLDRIARYQASGADGVILGCTEIPMLLKGCATAIPAFDTLNLHCEAILRFAYGA